MELARSYGAESMDLSYSYLVGCVYKGRLGFYYCLLTFSLKPKKFVVGPFFKRTPNLPPLEFLVQCKLLISET